MSLRSAAMELGAFVVSHTPFDADGGLDEPAIRSHFQRLARSGIGVYVGGSGSGEGLTLSPEETLRLYKIATEELKGKVPVRAMGIEPRTVEEMIALAGIAAEANLDAMQVYSPLAPGATQDELETYFAKVVSAIDLPAVISIHHAVGYTVSPAVVGRLVDRLDQIIGVNCTRSDIELLDRVGARVAVHVADMAEVLNNLGFGGSGFLCGEANIVPRLCVRLVKNFKAGDFKQAFVLAKNLLRVHHKVTAKFGVRGIKAAMNILGLGGGSLRSPRLPMSNEDEAQLRADLEQLNIPEMEGLAN